MKIISFNVNGIRAVLKKDFAKDIETLNPDILVICHGGPIAEPEDARYVIEHTKGVDGFFGASSIERCSLARFICGRIIRKYITAIRINGISIMPRPPPCGAGAAACA